LDRNDYLDTANTLQTAMYKTAIANSLITTKGNPIKDEFLVDIFLTEKGEDHILLPPPAQVLGCGKDGLDELTHSLARCPSC
jgi:hypothetical protein